MSSFVGFIDTRLAYSQPIRTWNDFSSEIELHNPRILSLKEKSKSVNLLPAFKFSPPTFYYSRMGSANPFVDTMEQSYEITQKIPFPSKITESYKLKDSRIDEIDSELKVELQKIRIEAAKTFVEFAKASRELELVKEKKEFFKNHLSRLNSMVISDQSQKIHILEVTTEIGQTDILSKEIEQTLTELRSAISVWIGADVKIADHIELPVSAAQVSSAKQNTTVEELSQKRISVAQQEAALGTKEWLPDLTLTYKRRDRLKDDVAPSSHEFMVGVDLPFIWGTQRLKEDLSLRALTQQKIYEAAEQKINTTAQISVLTSRSRSNLERASLIKSAVLPLLNEQLKILHQSSANDFESLDKHRETFEKLNSAKMRLVALESDYSLSNLQLEILTKE